MNESDMWSSDASMQDEISSAVVEDESFLVDIQHRVTETSTSSCSNVDCDEVVDQNVIWTPEVVFRVATIGVVMILTLVGNISLTSVITCHASLRRKRVSVFLLNLAVGDLMVCFVTMTTEILFVAFGEWVLGAVACKVIVYGQIVTLASTTFLLTAMSIDRYQVTLIISSLSKFQDR